MKIRSVAVEEAAGIQTAGPGWGSSMAANLGETKEIQQIGGGRCQLAGGCWWMLGLLEVPLERGDDGIQIGSMVRVRDAVSPRYGWAGVRGQRGQVIETLGSDVRVRFPSCSRWRGLRSELELCEGEDFEVTESRGIRVGSLVRVRAGVTPRHGWGSVSPGERGRVVLLGDGGDVRIDFPSQSGW